MKSFKNLLIFVGIAAGSAFAQTETSPASEAAESRVPEAMETAPAYMTEGEVRKVDMEAKKITLKHGEIKNLNMPSMTMVFQVKDLAMLERVKSGDKVRFKAEKLNGAIVVTDLQLAN